MPPDSKDENKIVNASCLRNIVTQLEVEHHMVYLDLLGTGGFGVVVHMKNKKSNKDIAIKIVFRRKMLEEKAWPKLKHPSILPLLYKVKINNHTTAFFMPLMRTALQEKIRDLLFVTSPLVYEYLKIYLKQVLAGLCYMHSKGYCHRDIKADNVFITHTGNAVLGDFSLIEKINYLKNGAILKFLPMTQPPELTRSFHQKKVGNGKCGDCWQYGVLLVDVLSQGSLSRRLMKVTDKKKRTFENIVFPYLLNFQRQKHFKTVMTLLYGPKQPATEFEMALDFLKGYLCEDIDKRLAAEDGFNHSWFWLIPNDVSELDKACEHNTLIRKWGKLWDLSGAEEEQHKMVTTDRRHYSIVLNTDSGETMHEISYRDDDSLNKRGCFGFLRRPFKLINFFKVM